MKTTLILSRHGHVDGIEPQRFRGRSELALTARGVAQAHALSQRIVDSGWRPAAIYASPMGRSIDTATIVAAPFAVPVDVMPELNDIDYGAWQGLTPDEVRARWPRELALWQTAPQTAALPGGERLQEVAARVTAGLRQMLDRHAGQLVVAVAHDSVNRVLLMHLLDLPLSRYWSITQSPCTINVVEFEHDQAFVRSLNETQHLTSVEHEPLRA